MGGGGGGTEEVGKKGEKLFYSWSGSNGDERERVDKKKRREREREFNYLSSTATRWPAAASWLAVVRPPIPEPMTIASYSVSGEALAECWEEEDGTAATTTQPAIDRARRGIFTVALARKRDAVAPFELVRHADLKFISMCIVIGEQKETKGGKRYRIKAFSFFFTRPLNL